MKKINIFIFSFILFSNVTFCQKESIDTSFFYSITLVEKQTVMRDVDNSVFNGNCFESMFVVCNQLDTIRFAYDYPFMILKKENLTKLKKCSFGKNCMYLYMKYSNKVKTFLVKMPFNIFFDKYYALLSHNKLKSKKMYCKIGSDSKRLNTSNLQFVTATDVSDSATRR